MTEVVANSVEGTVRNVLKGFESYNEHTKNDREFKRLVVGILH